jgi:hypothetical protein
MADLTFKDVWNKLSKIDVSEHIEQKMGLSYLSWAWAWGTLMDNYPEAEFSFYEGEDRVPYVTLPDGTCEVRCRVSIGNLQDETEESFDNFIDVYLQALQAFNTVKKARSWYATTKNQEVISKMATKFPEKKEEFVTKIKEAIKDYPQE